MMKWTSQDLDDFCRQAVELLNKKKGLHLEFVNCWLFSNSAGSNFHIVYRNKFLEQSFEISRNGKILQDGTVGVDKIAEIERIEDLKLKIVLRIAYYIFRDCKQEMKEDK